MNKYLTDKSGETIYCGFDYGKCGELATNYLIPPLKYSPLCKKHYDFLMNNAGLIYISDPITGKGHTETQEEFYNCIGNCCNG